MTPDTSRFSIAMSLGILAQLKEQKKSLQREIYRVSRLTLN
jgi:hypothetical protein